MRRQDVINNFWEELDAYTLNNHQWSKEWKRLVDSSIERAIIRAQHKNKTIAEILSKKREIK